MTDQACLEAWRREPGAESLRPLVERYAAFVYSSAYRRLGSAEQAGEVTHAVFLVLARRARKLRKKSVLAGWLFLVTTLACRKISGKSRRGGWRRWFGGRPKSDLPLEASLWSRVAPELDSALERLSAAQRDAVLLRVLLNQDADSVARTLRTTEPRAARRVERGLKKLTRRLRRRGVSADAEVLAQVCSAEGCAAPLPSELAGSVVSAMAAVGGRKPALKLARRTLKALAWVRWRRRLAIGFVVYHLLLGIVGGVLWYLDSLTGHSRSISTFVMWSMRFNLMRMPEMVELARPWLASAATPRPQASGVGRAQDLYHTTNIWLIHLNFTRAQWQALEPRSIGPMPNLWRPDGMPDLRNPEAKRSGFLGVLGYEFDWTHADFEFGGVAFTNVGVRVKGNLVSLCGPKHSFKVDLDRFARGQKLSGLDELTFNNLFWDYSCMGEALAYEFFRDAGVPASRTAYAWLSTSVARQWDRQPFGLYLMLEPVSKAFVAERFGSKKTPLFKPVTYDLFKYLGDDWSAYAGIYDLKTRATAVQKRRLIELARLVSSATDAEFAARVGDFVDLDEFARFLAGQVLLSNYDSILADGQNFFMYLDPHSNKFGFVPWDLDSAWGDFWLASKAEMARASIWHPWAGANRFLERVMALPEFRRIYRAHLEDFLARLFVPDRLRRRFDEMAAVLRDPISAESPFRLNKFEQAVGLKPLKPTPGEKPHGLNHPPNDLRRFVELRARSVRQQLDGKSKGMILKSPRVK